jgi:hypothetical protein
MVRCVLNEGDESVEMVDGHVGKVEGVVVE